MGITIISWGLGGERAKGCLLKKLYTPQKFNIDTKNDGLENVSPFKKWRFWVSINVRFQGGTFHQTKTHQLLWNGFLGLEVDRVIFIPSSQQARNCTFIF